MPLQILQGGIQPWAPAGGGKSRRSIAPPPEKSRKFSSRYMGYFCFNFSMSGLLCYVFLIRVLRSQGAGGNSRQSFPLKKSAICMGAFLLPFLVVGAFCYVFLITILRPLMGGGRGARLGVRPSLKNEEKICFAIWGAFLLLFSLCGFFLLYVVHHGGRSLFAIFFMLGAFFVFMEGGGVGFFMLAPSY